MAQHLVKFYKGWRVEPTDPRLVSAHEGVKAAKEKKAQSLAAQIQHHKSLITSATEALAELESQAACMVMKYEEATAQIRDSKTQLECLSAQLACLRPESSSCEPPEPEPESVVHWVQGLKGALTKEYVCLSSEGNKQLDDGFSALEGMLAKIHARKLEGTIQKPL
eukprot:4703098-Pyramimonas_sp.AAC.1